MDESGIIGQMILESSGRIKKSSGTLDNPKLIPFITTIVSSTAKILEKQSLSRVTLSYQESDILIIYLFCDYNDKTKKFLLYYNLHRLNRHSCFRKEKVMQIYIKIICILYILQFLYFNYSFTMNIYLLIVNKFGKYLIINHNLNRHRFQF